MDRLLCRVIPLLVLFRFRQDAKKSGIASGHPAPESEPAREEEQSGDQTVEQVEGADRGCTDEEEQRPFYPEVREGLELPLLKPVCAPAMDVCLHRGPP